MLDTLTEHNFKDAIKKMTESLGLVYMSGGDYFEIHGSQQTQDELDGNISPKYFRCHIE